MERKEAIALLKELIDRDLVHPSFVSLNGTGDKFSLMFNGDCASPELKQFALDRSLSITETRGYCLVFEQS